MKWLILAKRVFGVGTAAAIFCYLFFDHLALLGLNFFAGRVSHGTINLVAFNDEGVSLDGPEVFRIWRPGLIIRDQQGSPVFGVQYGLGSAKIAVPPRQPVSLEMLWPVPGFGKVLVSADNQGRGYQVPKNETLTIELVPEFARSRLFQIRQWVQDHNSGRCVSAEAAAKLDSASRFIREMEDSRDPRRRAELAISALGLELKAGEQEVLAEARDTIEKRRCGTLRVKIEDSAGKPVPFARVTAVQQRFDFLFGVFSDGYDADGISRLRAMGLNYAILFMTWNRMEPRPNAYSFEQFDALFNPSFLRKNGFTLCGHAILWLASGEVPDYVDAMRGNPDALEGAVRQHVSAIVGRYKDRVQIWEAMNEGHPAWSRWGLDDTGLVRLTKASAEEIRKGAPGAQIMIEVTMPLAEDVALKYYPLMSFVSCGRIGAGSSEAYQYVDRLNRSGVSYDILGLQDYNGAVVNVGPGGVQVPAIDLFRFASEIDRYSKLGKPLQIAEISVGSSVPLTGVSSWWHAKPDEQTQADYLEGAFTIAYGNLHVQGINWWGFDDGYDFVEHGGLFDSSRHPKTAAIRLTKLLEEWRTNRQMSSGDDGFVSFAGASGDYLVSARQDNKKPVLAHAHIFQGNASNLIIRLPKESSGRVDPSGGSGAIRVVPFEDSNSTLAVSKH
jgi:endo-1,4-beta-xylanase